jgi:tetratricopeptide (TPR) repeat protein
MVETPREEEAMAYNRSLIYVLTAMLSMAAAPAFPAEEVFDTATASRHLEQGISHLKAKDFDAAITEFDESAAISPEAEAYYYLGYAYYMKSRKSDGEDRKKALENFDRAYEIDPNFSPTRFKPSEPAPQQTTTPARVAEPVAPQPAAPQTPTPEQPKP